MKSASKCVENRFLHFLEHLNALLTATLTWLRLNGSRRGMRTRTGTPANDVLAPHGVNDVLAFET